MTKAADELYAAKRERYGPEIMGQVEKSVLLQTLDHLWRDHIITVDYLRQVIHLRGYGQRDPLNEYKTEGFNLFEAMLAKLRENTTSTMMRVEIQQRGEGRRRRLAGRGRAARDGGPPHRRLHRRGRCRRGAK